jgi:hypothetical protein
MSKDSISHFLALEPAEYLDETYYSYHDFNINGIQLNNQIITTFRHQKLTSFYVKFGSDSLNELNNYFTKYYEKELNVAEPINSKDTLGFLDHQIVNSDMRIKLTSISKDPRIDYLLLQKIGTRLVYSVEYNE